MKIFGRKLFGKYRESHELDVDEVVFVVGNLEIVVSLYRARTDGRIEVRSNDGVLIVLPRAANVIEIESKH